MKRIFVLSLNNNLGGAEQYLKMVASHFENAQIDIYFLKQTNNSEWISSNKNISTKFMSKSSMLIGAIKLFFLLINNKKQYNHAFTSHVHTNAYVGFLRSIGVLKTDQHIARESTSIFLRYTGLKLRIYKLYYKLGYKKINLIICQTQLMKDQLVKNFKNLTKNTKVVVIPNPVDLKTISELSKEKPKYEYNYIVSAGRLIHVKGYDILIEAFSKLKQVNKDLKLVILGQGELLDDLKNLVSNLNIKNDVIFEGHVSNVLPYFKNAKACVVSSRLEGFPNVLLQMMSQNNVVISTKCAGGIENISGIISCETNSVESLYNGLVMGLSLKNPQSNRKLFDAYLEDRNIGAFLDKVMAQLDQ